FAFEIALGHALAAADVPSGPAAAAQTVLVALVRAAVPFAAVAALALAHPLVLAPPALGFLVAEPGGDLVARAVEEPAIFTPAPGLKRLIAPSRARIARK